MNQSLNLSNSLPFVAIKLLISVGAQRLYQKNGYKEVRREQKARLPWESIFYEKDLVV